MFAGCLMKDAGGEGALNLEKEGKITGRLVTVQLDVTSDKQVEAALKVVQEKLPSHYKVPIILFIDYWIFDF